MLHPRPTASPGPAPSQGVGTTMTAKVHRNLKSTSSLAISISTLQQHFHGLRNTLFFRSRKRAEYPAVLGGILLFFVFGDSGNILQAFRFCQSQTPLFAVALPSYPLERRCLCAVSDFLYALAEIFSLVFVLFLFQLPPALCPGIPLRQFNVLPAYFLPVHFSDGRFDLDRQSFSTPLPLGPYADYPPRIVFAFFLLSPTFLN